MQEPEVDASIVISEGLDRGPFLSQSLARDRTLAGACPWTSPMLWDHFPWSRRWGAPWNSPRLPTCFINSVLKESPMLRKEGN